MHISMNVAISATVLGRYDTRTEPSKLLVCCLIFLHISKMAKKYKYFFLVHFF